MKKILCLILAAMILCGCSRNQSEIETPITFYYTNAEITYNSPAAVISPEVRDGANYKDNLIGLLDLYFAGPLSEDLRSPFPANTITMNLYRDDEAINIEVSKEFASLKGLNLTIACSCLTSTIVELTNCDVVNIYVADTLLDGNYIITMRADDLLLLDESI